MRYAAIFTLSLMLAHAAQGQIAWEQSLKDAHAKAKQEGKLLLLHFYSDNCVWCDKLEDGAFKNPSVADALAKDFVPVKIHGGQNPKLTGMFKVTKYPTDVIVTSGGKALTHQVSPQQAPRYVAMLSGAQTRYTQQTAVASAPKTAPPPTSPMSAAQLPVQVPSPNISMSSTDSQARPSLPPVAAPVSNVAAPVSNKVTERATRSTTRDNQFLLTNKAASGVTASLASARTNDSSASTKQSSRTEKHPLAIDGFCAVSVIKNGEWVEGSKDFGVVHLGKLYVFASKSALETFLADPMPYTPMLDGIDIVRFFEEKRIVRGRREWGVIDPIHNRMYFFADEKAMKHFEEYFEIYLNPAMEVMAKAVSDANPGL